MRILELIALRLLMLGAVLQAASVASAATLPERAIASPVATQTIVPVDRLAEGWWAERHRSILATIARHADPEILLIGDSITNNYDKAVQPDEDFQPIWQTFYGPRRALNLGFSGDTAAHVLWRLQNGEVEGLKPKAVILLIGTNDTGWAGHDAIETRRGIDAVIAELERRLPKAKILLLGILPSAISEQKTATDNAVNAYLEASYSDNPQVTYLDIGSIFYRHDGELDTILYYDPRLPKKGGPLHPDTIGQRRMAEAIEPTLANMLGEPPEIPLAAMTAGNTAIIPVFRLELDSYDWHARHNAARMLAKDMHPRVVMIGDSITHFWAGPPEGRRISGASSWQRLFHAMPVLNLGFGWDRTQNVLWRLRHGEFDGLTPEWVVINIGTNNLTATDNARANSPQEIVAAIDAIVHIVKARSPKSRIILMGIFPRGSRADSPLRKPIAQTNGLLAQRFAHDPIVRFLDIGPRFLDRNGTLSKTLMPDETHPSEAGYAIWEEALISAGIHP